MNLKKIGDNPLYVIHDDTFKSWFKVAFDEVDGKKPNENCVIEEYELTDVDGKPLSQDILDVVSMSKHYNDYIHQDILVNLDKQIDSPISVYVQADTYGKKVARREIKITVNLNEDEVDPPCHFSIKEKTAG